MKILIYNNFHFHHDLYGFLLEYCTEHNIHVDIYNPIDMFNYADMYRVSFKFNIVSTYDANVYAKIFLITDSDWSFNNFSDSVKPKLVSIEHWYKIRNECVTTHIPISPFNNAIYKENFIMPVHNIIGVNATTKTTITLQKINIVILGRMVPNSYDHLDVFEDMNNITFHLINFNKKYNYMTDKENIKTYDLMSATSLYNLLYNSNYVYMPNIIDNYNKGYSTSSSIFMALSLGCRLIMPSEMNKYLRIRSAIIYDNYDSKIRLPSDVDYNLVFSDRDYYINIRNKILKDIINE